jgi:hypothetical protein
MPSAKEKAGTRAGALLKARERELRRRWIGARFAACGVWSVCGWLVDGMERVADTADHLFCEHAWDFACRFTNRPGSRRSIRFVRVRLGRPWSEGT